MPTAPNNSVIVFGVLQPDGTVRLDHPPALPPGPIQITIRPVPRQRERLPDLPLEDTSELPPFDLPRAGVAQEVQPVRVLERLPDPYHSAEFD